MRTNVGYILKKYIGSRAYGPAYRSVANLSISSESRDFIYDSLWAELDRVTPHHTWIVNGFRDNLGSIIVRRLMMEHEHYKSIHRNNVSNRIGEIIHSKRGPMFQRLRVENRLNGDYSREANQMRMHLEFMESFRLDIYSSIASSMQP
jgi:hypothetical protein